MSDGKEYMENLPKNHKTEQVENDPDDQPQYRCVKCGVYTMGQFDPSTCLGAEPVLTETERIALLKREAIKSLEVAQKAWHKYWTACDLGNERIRGAEVYERLMNVTRG